MEIQSTVASAPARIRCAEIWGGIHSADTAVCTRGLSASIFSAAAGDVKGGDIYYFSVCSSDLLSRVALADMRGHGTEASLLSASLYESMQEHMNTLDGSGILSDLNQEVRRHGFLALTTAAVVGYYSADSKLYFSYAGHPPLFVRSAGQPWTSLRFRNETTGANLPLGVLAAARYDQEGFELRPGDRLLLYTDGVLECPNAAGEEFGEGRLLKVLNGTDPMPISEVKQQIAEALFRHSGGALVHDDCTFMIIEINDHGKG